MPSNGPRQAALLARVGTDGTVIPAGNAEKCAARRLMLRGVLVRHRFGGPRFGYLDVYRVVS